MSTVVPDSIDVIEGWRSWTFSNAGLGSITRSVHWIAGTELQAHCPGSKSWIYPFGTHITSVRYPVWTLSRGGMSTEKATEYRERSSLGHIPPVPAVVPPTWMGWWLSYPQEQAHVSPHEDCSCGIYAAANLTLCPPGDVYGKVKLWGKVVPGEQGWRAQYAYPSLLYAAPEIARHPALMAYGVEIVEQEQPFHANEVVVSALSMMDRGRRVRRFLYGAIGLNLASAVINLSTTNWRPF